MEPHRPRGGTGYFTATLSGLGVQGHPGFRTASETWTIGCWTQLPWEVVLTARPGGGGGGEGQFHCLKFVCMAGSLPFSPTGAWNAGFSEDFKKPIVCSE